MARLKALEKSLGKLFKAPAPKKVDKFRKAREEAKRLAALHGIEIEKLPDGGMNVWAPRALADTPADPYDGDHLANDWAEALVMVKEYSARVAKLAT